MIRSMTGFARRERQGPWGTLTCELRSVNHRYLELSLRLPEDLRGLENDARQLLSRRAAARQGGRRRVPARRAGGRRPLELNRPLGRAAGRRRRARCGTIAGGAAGTLNPLDVLRWPGVIRDVERDVTPIAAAAMELLRETVGGPERRTRTRRRTHPRHARAALRSAARVGDARCKRSPAGGGGAHPRARARARRPARHDRRRRTPRAGDRAAGLQDGRRGGTRPARQPHRPRRCRCSTRRSPPAAGSTS